MYCKWSWMKALVIFVFLLKTHPMYFQESSWFWYIAQKYSHSFRINWLWSGIPNFDLINQIRRFLKLQELKKSLSYSIFSLQIKVVFQGYVKACWKVWGIEMLFWLLLLLLLLLLLYSYSSSSYYHYYCFLFSFSLNTYKW